MQTDPKNLIIADGSVMIKWCVKEKEDRQQILRMQEDFIDKKIHILINTLIYWEINNYLGRHFSTDLATEKYSDFKVLGLEEHMLSLESSHVAFTIMKKCPGVSFYDASYHALALTKGGLLVTADKKYYEKAKKLGNIRLLKDYK